MRRASTNGVAVLDSSPCPHGAVSSPLLLHHGITIEHVDRGATYYAQHFFGLGMLLSVFASMTLGLLVLFVRLYLRWFD